MSKKIKLLSVIETLGRGGAERVLVNTLPELQKLGIKCEVAILFQRDDLANELEHQGIKVQYLNLSHRWNVIEAIYKLKKLLAINNYDIVHSHLFFSYFYIGLLKIIKKDFFTVVTFHNLGYNAYPADTFLKKIRKNIDSLIVRTLFDKATAVSTAVKKHYEKNLHLNNIDVIFNSFPLDELYHYKKSTTHSTLDKYVRVKKNTFLILTPGRLVKEKGHKYLVGSIKLLNQRYVDFTFTFIFIGKGPLIEIIKDSIPDNVKLILGMPHSDLMKIYREVDLIVIPSVHEAFGLVIGEAMIMEKAIIATEVDGIVEMITNEVEGLLVPYKSSEALANAIERLFLDSNFRDILAKNAKEKIKRFDTRIIAKQWKYYYEEMLK